MPHAPLSQLIRLNRLPIALAIAQGGHVLLSLEETAEIVFKSILYYVLFTDGETKTLNRCKEIAKYGINGIDGINKIRDLVANEERANILFKPVEIASEATAKAVFEKLNERLSKI